MMPISVLSVLVGPREGTGARGFFAAAAGCGYVLRVGFRILGPLEVVEGGQPVPVGGSGKTRLALEAARAQLGSFPDGV